MGRNVDMGVDKHTCALSNSHQPSEQEPTSCSDQPSRPLCVEDWAYLHAAEESEEGKDTEDPAYAGRRVVV